MITTTLASSVTHSCVFALAGLLGLLAAAEDASFSLGLAAGGPCLPAGDRSSAAPGDKRAVFVIPGLYAVNKSDAWVVVFEGQSIDSRLARSVILHTSDGGATWKRQLITEAQMDDGVNRKFLSDVHFINARVGWAAGYSGTILKTTDGGESWQGQASPSEGILSKIQFVDDNWGWILAEEGGEIIHTEDGGINWRSYKFDAPGRMMSLSFHDKFNGWIVGENGQAFETRDAGRSWIPRGRDLAVKLGSRGLRDVVFWRVKFLSRDIGFIAAGLNYNWPKYTPNGVILETRNGGRTWQRIIATKTLGLTDADFVTDKNIWVALGDYRDERLLHTIDGGKRWAFVHATSKPRTIRFVDANNGWLIAGLWDYPITDNLLRTNNGGLTWSEVKLPKWSGDK